MDAREKMGLDRYITGNYGEDQHMDEMDGYAFVIEELKTIRRMLDAHLHWGKPEDTNMCVSAWIRRIDDILTEVGQDGEQTSSSACKCADPGPEAAGPTGESGDALSDADRGLRAGHYETGSGDYAAGSGFARSGEDDPAGDEGGSE